MDLGDVNIHRVLDLQNTLVSLALIQPMCDPHEKSLTCRIFWKLHHIQLDILPLHCIIAFHITRRRSNVPGHADIEAIIFLSVLSWCQHRTVGKCTSLIAMSSEEKVVNID